MNLSAEGVAITHTSQPFAWASSTKAGRVAPRATSAGNDVQHSMRPIRVRHLHSLELRDNADPSRQVAQPWRRGAPLTLEQDHDQLRCDWVVAYFLRSQLLRLQECRDRSRVISSVGVATSNVDQQMRTPLNQIRRKASRLNEPCSPQDLSAVTELSRHLNALDRQARRPKDRVKVRMVTPSRRAAVLASPTSSQASPPSP